MSREDENGNGHSLNHRTKVTLGLVIVVAPFVVWAAKADNRIENLEKDRAELKSEIKDLNRKMDRILSRWSHSLTP